MIQEILKRLGAVEKKVDKASFVLATVNTIVSGKVTLLIGAETTDSGQLYEKLSGYTPTVNDRVLCAKIANTLVVLGKY